MPGRLLTGNFTGKALGGARHNMAVATAVRQQKAAVKAANVVPIECIRRAGVTSLKGIAEALNARGIKTARGGEWQATQMARTLAKDLNPVTR